MSTSRPLDPSALAARRAPVVAALATVAATFVTSLAGTLGAQTSPAPAPAPSLPAPGAPTAPSSSPATPNVPGGTSNGGTPAPVTPGTLGTPTSASGNTTTGSTASTQVGPLSLGAAARLAARQSAGSEEARLRVEQATARLRQSRSALLPSLSLLGSQNQRTFNTASFGITFPSVPGQPPLFDPNGQVAGPVNIYDFRGRLASSLFDASAIERVRASRTLVRAGNSDADAQAQLAAANTASAYLRVLQAEAQLENRVADSTLAAELLVIARQQLQAGTGVGLDVTRAESQLAGTRAQLIASRNQRDRARLDLARAAGIALDQPLVLTDRLTTLPTEEAVPDEAAAVQTALRRRADLRTAADQVAAARQSAQAIRAERLPSVQAFVDDGNTGLGFTRGRLLNTYTYGVQVSVPIFDGYRREGRLQEQQAAASELDVRARDLQTQAAVDVRGALLDLRSAREQVEAARERQRLATQELSQARDRFRAGVAGNADVITASQSLTGARTALADALAQYQGARVALARAQGTVVDLP